MNLFNVSELYLADLLISLPNFFLSCRFIQHLRMTIESRKRGRSPLSPRIPYKKRKLSPPRQEIKRHARIRPESPCNRSPCRQRRTNRRSRTPPSPPIRVSRRVSHTITSRELSPIRVTVRSEIRRPPASVNPPAIIHRPRTPPSPINYSRRRPSPIHFQRHAQSTNRPEKRDLSPMRIQSPALPTRQSSERSPVRGPVELPNERVVKKKNKGNKLVISVKNPARGNKCIRVLKLEGVSNNISLSHLVHEFIVEVSSIIGCHRVADYEAELLDGIVFLYLTNEAEFNDLLSRDYIVLEGCIIGITDPKLIYGNAKYTIPFGTASRHDMRMSPHPMGMFGMRQLTTTTTFYIVAVLRELEQEGTVTGFKLAYCDHRQLTRNFGFATFINRINAFKVNGKKFNIMGDLVEAKLPSGMPFLISEDHKHLAENHRCDFSEEIRGANWLNVNLLDSSLPMRPLAAGEIFNPPSSTIEPIQTPQSKPRSMQTDTSKVVRHETPPASPTLSIGDDYEIDEDGILAVPSTFWLNASPK